MRSLSMAQRRVLIDLFFKTPNLDIMRQSIHRLTFEGTEVNQQSEFLLVTICCLAALYVSEADVSSVFNGESAAKLSQKLADVAQKCSRDTSDQPTGTWPSHNAESPVYLADKPHSTIHASQSPSWLPRTHVSHRPQSMDVHWFSNENESSATSWARASSATLDARAGSQTTYRVDLFHHG